MLERMRKSDDVKIIVLMLAALFYMLIQVAQAADYQASLATTYQEQSAYEEVVALDDASSLRILGVRSNRVFKTIASQNQE